MTAPRRRWFKFSLRTLFAVVTLVAMGSWQWQRARRLHLEAKEHADQAFGWSLAFVNQKRMDNEMRRRVKDNEPRIRAIIAYHEGMSRRCREAVWRPWYDLSQTPPRPR